MTQMELRVRRGDNRAGSYCVVFAVRKSCWRW